MLYIIFRYKWEPVLIGRILIGFKSLLKKNITWENSWRSGFHYFPEKFKNVFAEALKEGFRTVAHAGEEGSPDYIWQALDLLKVSRIDHGVRCLEDDALVARLKEEQTHLTVCPLSNIKLCVFENITQHNLKKLLDCGISAGINSDDPAYFGGYMNENFIATQAGLELSISDLKKISINAFKASFLSDKEKSHWLKVIQEL